MTNPERWSTKADILKDLAQVSTTETIDVDEQDIVVGEKPPPPRRFEQDDEFNYRFQDYEYGRPHEDKNVGPDLEGITHMLRMVNEFENPSEDDFRNTTRGAEVDVVISKLNPNVPEFVPKSATTSSLSDKENEAVADKNSISVANSKKTINCNINQNIDKKHKDCDCDIDININKRIDISKLNPDAIKNITTKLRNKISGQLNDDPQGKREKNVAIATLLKIYSANSGPAKTISPVENEKPMKLFPPQYFQTCHASTDTNEEAKKDSTELSNNDDSVSDLIKLSVSSGSKKSECVETSSEMNINSSTSNSLVSKSPIRNRCYEDPQVRESIKKVNNWFEKPKSQKPKGSVVCLGPVSFKRKEVSSKSPTSVSDVESKRSTSTDTAKQNVTHYQPSKYAHDLSKIYSERSKVLEEQKLDLWARLEKEMKEKEEEMKKAKSGTSSSSPEETENNASSDVRSE